MRYFIAAVSLMASTLFAQTVVVEKFSDEYYATIDYSDEEVEHGRVVKIYAAKNDEILIKKHVYFYDNDNDDYKPSDFVLYMDFNFDGVKDIAIIVDRACGMGNAPSYDIYLKTPKGFQHSPQFSELADCGMFDMNKTSKKIYTNSGSGMGWTNNEYFVRGYEPYLLKSTEGGPSAISVPVIHYSQTLCGEFSPKDCETKSWAEFDPDFYADENIYKNILLSFTAHNDKRIILYHNDEENSLYYIFTNKESRIELICPSLDDDECGHDSGFKFDLNDKKNELSFKNKNTTYAVYDYGEKFGVNINTANKTYNLKGKAGSKNSSLSTLKDMTFKNLDKENK